MATSVLVVEDDPVIGASLRDSLRSHGYDVRAVVVAERQPADVTWQQLLAEECIGVVWPNEFESFIASLNP